MAAGSIRERVRQLFAAQTVVVEPPEDLLEASLELAQTQLLAQIADETSIDGRTMGVLAFLGALLAADIAAKDVIGHWWWLPLIAIAFATAPCLRSTFGRDTDLGPLSATFYETFGGHESRLAREQLLADLGAAFRANATRVKAKRGRLRWAVAIISVGLVASSLTIAFDTPTKLKADGKHGNSKAASARTGETTGPVRLASRLA